ncbi:TPA: hypothetical protein ACTXXA_000857 [Legionella anisa]
MTPAKDLPKIIEKSQDEIEEIITLVQSSNIPEELKPFVIGCIHFASWIPKALVDTTPITHRGFARALFVWFVSV